MFDENRKIDKAFKCEKHLLIKYMKYFEKYITDGTKCNDIDISVHCDIKIFEWLIRYLHQKERMLKSQVINAFAAKHNIYKKKSDDERVKEKEFEQS